MAPQQDRTDGARHPTPPEHTPRLRLKPKAPQSGYVDGAWWPHSDDLTKGLSLCSRCSRCDWAASTVCCISSATGRKHPPNWPRAATRCTSMGTDCSRRTPSKSSDSTATGIVLLVVPPHTDADRAHATLTAAAAPDNDSTVDGLLSISLRDRKSRTQRTAARERWDSEGGADRWLVGVSDRGTNMNPSGGPLRTRCR